MTDPVPAKVSANELMKAGSPTLAGTIAQTLADPTVEHFSKEDNYFLKFHGMYEQDDRDLRKTGKKYILMVRVRIPGGVLTPDQYLALDTLSTQYANNTLRVTSRQALQFHGVLKSNLRSTIHGINDTLLTTIAACGDVVRNVLAPPRPTSSPIAAQLQEDALLLANAFRPRTPAYHQIWLNGQELDLAETPEPDFVDPLYGKTYLPRKFKFAFALPPINDVDVFANCIGFVGIEEHGDLVGYNLLAGGGMGRSLGNEQTFPRLADVIGFLPPEHVEAVAHAAVTIHRDFGDRANRKHARVKYILADRGVDWFRSEIERRSGVTLGPAKPFAFTSQADSFGWHSQGDGRCFLGLFIEAGRIKDTETQQLKTGLRALISRFHPTIHLTPANNLYLGGLHPRQQHAITHLLTEHGILLPEQRSVTRRAATACVALPTCGLALAESERYLPHLMTGLEGLLAELGLSEQELILRVTGCPNGCARPYMAELGLVGRAPGRYQVYVGGNEAGTRLARLLLEDVDDAHLLDELRPVLGRYARERTPGERFGDWCARALGT